MSHQPTHDIFITHAWRYHDDWMKSSELLDAETSIKWRNFSVPWYDPALEPHTPLGARAIRTWLDGQIRPVIGVILLDSVYAVNSAKKWLDTEVELARLHNKPIVVLPAFGAETVSPEARALADEQVRWNALEIIAALTRLNAAIAQTA